VICNSKVSYYFYVTVTSNAEFGEKNGIQAQYF